jgi:hypothetical protein
MEYSRAARQAGRASHVDRALGTATAHGGTTSTGCALGYGSLDGGRVLGALATKYGSNLSNSGLAAPLATAANTDAIHRENQTNARPATEVASLFLSRGSTYLQGVDAYAPIEQTRPRQAGIARRSARYFRLAKRSPSGPISKKVRAISKYIAVVVVTTCAIV